MRYSTLKEEHTHRVYFREVKDGKVVQKSFTCPKSLLQWHLKEVKKMHSDVTFEVIRS